MNRWRYEITAVLAGTVAGGAVLGVGGRLAMAALPLLTGARPRFSWGGSFEVLLLGTGYGALGGIVLAALRWVPLPLATMRGVALGLMLLAFAWASSPVGRATAPTAPVPISMILLISALLFLIYGIVTEALVRRWSSPEAGAL